VILHEANLRYRVAKTHRIPYIFTGRFPQQSPIISGSFAENDLQRLRKVTYEIRHPMGLRHPVHKCHMSEWKSYTNESRKRESLFITTRIIYEYGVLYSCDDTRGKYALHFNCHMNTLYRVWMSHVTYRYAVSHEYVVLHINEPCHIWIHGITSEYVVPRINEPRHIWTRRITYMIPSYYIININEPCHIWVHGIAYEYVVLHINEPCHIWIHGITYEYVVPRINEPRHIWTRRITYEYVVLHNQYKWAMSHMDTWYHIWIRHITYKWAMSHMDKWYHIWIRRTTYKRATSHMDTPYHIHASVVLHNQYKWAISHMDSRYHIWIRSYHVLTSHATYGYAVSHIWIRRIT